jgi:hypothetical protein
VPDTAIVAFDAGRLVTDSNGYGQALSIVFYVVPRVSRTLADLTVTELQLNSETPDVGHSAQIQPHRASTAAASA